MHPKEEVYIDTDYLNFVRALPCVSCGKPPKSDAHHCWPRGRRKKTAQNDFLSLPLCRKCHQDYHQYGHDGWEFVTNVNCEWEIIRLMSNYIHERNKDKNSEKGRVAK